MGDQKEAQGALNASPRDFPHKWAMMFLIAVGVWNFLGAGVFGFLINLPIVSYYEIGTNFTANHAHGALIGRLRDAGGGLLHVCGPLLHTGGREESELAMKTSFWSLNIGLGWMVVANLDPSGRLSALRQLQEWILACTAARILYPGAIAHHRMAETPRRHALHRRDSRSSIWPSGCSGAKARGKGRSRGRNGGINTVISL